MTKEEKIKELEKETEELKRQLENERLYHNYLENGEDFYTTDENGSSGLTIIPHACYFDYSDCYRTEREQEDYIEYRKATMRLKNWIRSHNDGWKPDFSNKDRKFYIFYYCQTKNRMASDYLDYEFNFDYDTNKQLLPKWFYFKDIHLACHCIGEMRDDLITYFTYDNFGWLEAPEEEV